MDLILLSKNIKRNADGLSLMIFFTFLWTIIAEFALDNWIYRSFGLIFFIMIALFIIFNRKFNRIVKPYGDALKDEETPENRKRDKRFILIFVIEGLVILVTRNILVNIKMVQLFIPCLSLIVGLHFYPLGKLFNRKIDYYIASWLTIISIIGILMSIYQLIDTNITAAFIGFSCAIGTSIMGLYMINNGRKYIQLLREIDK